MSDIPGFYYDESKKKYFKILENKFTGTKGVFTKEKIASDAAEKKRKIDLINGHFSKNINANNINIYSSIQARQCKDSPDVEYQVSRRIYSGLRSNSVAALGYLNRTTPDKLTLKLQLNANQQSLVILCNSGVKNSIEFFDISQHSNTPLIKTFSNLHKNERKLNIALLPYAYEYNSSLVDVSLGKDDLVVSIGNGLRMQDKALVSINNMRSDVASNYYVSRLLNCVANDGRDRSIVGTSEGALIIDNSRSGIQHYQKFHIKSITPLNSTDPDANVVLMGLKRDGVVSCDLRSGSRPSRVFCHKTPKQAPLGVNHLHSLSDASSLLCSFFNGQILNVDLRNNKAITEYLEHKNDYVTTPLRVDPSEKFLSSVGVDCYTRVWDIRKGDLLSTIPAPTSTTRHCMPATTFLPTLHTTIPGIFMLLNDLLYVYTL